MATRAFFWISHHLKVHPLRTNVCLSTFIGFCGDVICQTVYDPYLGISRITPTSIPPESFQSPLLLRVPSPSLWWRHFRQNWSNRGSSSSSSSSSSLTASQQDKNVYLDLRRSLIFCSFSCCFSVPYFLWIYKHLDRLYPPAFVTKKQAILKGFLSYCAANLTTPLFMAHVTFLDRFFIYRDGRDGRRRIFPDSPHLAALPADRRAELSGKAAKCGKGPQPTIVLEHDKAFNRTEYLMCVRHDWLKRVRNDFPEVLRYGIVFWGVNWLPMFYYIPPHFRLLYSACLQVAWSGIMSYMLHRGER